MCGQEIMATGLLIMANGKIRLLLNGPCKKLIRVLAMAKVWAFKMCYVVLFLLCIIDNKNPYEICFVIDKWYSVTVH